MKIVQNSMSDFHVVFNADLKKIIRKIYSRTFISQTARIVSAFFDLFIQGATA